MSSLIRMVIDFVMSHTFLILQLSLDLFLIVLLILMFRRRKAKKEREMLFFREQESRRLTKRISNPAYLEREGIQFGRSYPYKVHDGGVLPAEQGGTRDQMVEISLQSKMLTREFLLPVSDGILIGRGPNNTISIDNPDVVEHQCRIFRNGSQLCVESLSMDHPTELQRGARSIQVSGKPMALTVGDIICFGDNRLLLKF